MPLRNLASSFTPLCNCLSNRLPHLPGAVPNELKYPTHGDVQPFLDFQFIEEVLLRLHSASHLHLVLSSASISVTSTTVTGLSPSLTASINLLIDLPSFPFLTAPSSAPFSRYTHHRSSVHVPTTPVLPLVSSLQTVPPALSLYIRETAQVGRR